MNPQPATTSTPEPLFASEAAAALSTLDEDLKDLDTSEEETLLVFAEQGLLLDEKQIEDVADYEAQVRSQVPRETVPETVVRPGQTAEEARNRLTHEMLVQHQQETEQYARMAMQAAKAGKPIPPVSLTLIPQYGDRTAMVDGAGRDLVPAGHVGLWVSYKNLTEDLTERDTREHVEAVISDGGQLVRDADKRPLRADFGYAMSLPIKASALRLARAAAGNVSNVHLDRERELAATFQANGFILSNDNDADIADTTMARDVLHV